jgi:hypothetical protein
MYLSSDDVLERRTLVELLTIVAGTTRTSNL